MLSMRKPLLLLVAAVSIVLFAGCEAWREAWEESGSSGIGWFEKYEPKYIVGVFRIVKYPRGNSDMERELSTIDGRTMYINTIQMISSKNFQEIRVLPRGDRPDRYDIRVRLDERGQRLWALMAAEYRGRELALMIDSIYYGNFMPQQLESESESWVTITMDRPFDEVTAAGLQKYSKKNYEHFNPSATSLF